MKVLTNDLFKQGLGAIACFSIRNAKVSRPDMEAWFADIGIPEKYMPNPLQPLNAYKSATGKDTKIEYPATWLSNDQKMRVLIREVSSNATQVERHIIREHVDAGGKCLSYDRIGQAIFTRAVEADLKTGRAATAARMDIEVNQFMLHELERNVLGRFLDKVRADYVMYCTFYTSNAVRMIVRDFTRDLNTINIKDSGGMYFLHRNKLGEVEKMIEFVGRVGGGSMYHAFPVVDDDYQRSMLTDAFELQVEAESRDLLEKIKAINTSGKDVKLAEYERLLDAYTDVLSRSEEHTELLGLSQDRAAVALEMVMDAVSEMGSRVAA